MSLILKNGTLKHVHQDRITILQQTIFGIELINSHGLLRRLAVRQLIDASTELFNISQKLCAESAMEFIIKPVKAVISITDIIEKTNESFGVNVLQKTRKREVCYARHAAVLLCKKFTRESLKNIGTAIGGRDHTTAIHSISACMNIMDTNDGYREQVNALITYFTQIIHAEENSITTKITTSENY